jgi:hypothetical protein
LASPTANLRDIVVSFLLAGRDTVSSALFMLLSKNPDVAAAIRAEAGHDSTPVTYEHLHYTHAVLYENMRLFPPVQFDSKFCTAADVLPDGTYVSGGARVMYHPYAMGRTPRLWGADHEVLAAPAGSGSPSSGGEGRRPQAARTQRRRPAPRAYPLRRSVAQRGRRRRQIERREKEERWA